MSVERKWFSSQLDRFQLLPREEKFRYACLMQLGAEYKSGSENAFFTDCSGTLTAPLALAFGYVFRTTADEYYREIFTENPNGVDAVFCITSTGKRHHGRYVSPGTATHVMPVIFDEGGHTVVLTAEKKGIAVKTLEAASAWYIENGCSIVKRGINHAAAKRYSGSKVYGLDPEMAFIKE